MKYRKHKYYTLDMAKSPTENLIEICKQMLPVEMSIEKLKDPEKFSRYYKYYGQPELVIGDIKIMPLTNNEDYAYTATDFSKIGFYADYNSSKIENNSIRVAMTYLKRTVSHNWRTFSITSLKDTYDKLKIDHGKKVLEESKKAAVNRSKMRRLNTLKKNISVLGNKKHVNVSNMDSSYTRFSLEVTDLTESQVEKINTEIAKILNEV